MKHVARKRFGQNFLHDQHVLDRITDSIAPAAGDTMVEIGPGLGAMTDQLTRSLPHMHVVELDRDLVARLQQRYRPEKLTVHAGDALKFDFGSLPVPQGQKLRIVGNLPYNISSPLLFHLATFAPKVKDQHFMLQKEVVERMVAEPGSNDYGKLSVMLQYRFYLEWLLDVPPESFNPPPKVDSAVVRLIPLPQPPAEARDIRQLEKLVSQAFGQKRKTLRNNLKGWLDDAALEALGIDPSARAETLSVAQFVAMANALPAGVGDSQ